MKILLKLCSGGAEKKYFEVLEYKFSSDDFDVGDGWKLFDFDGVGFPEGRLIFDGLNERLIKKPIQKNQDEVFDINLCSWVMPVDGKWSFVRRKRDALLAETDWRVARAQESGRALSAEWGAYRQALRDITQQPDPFVIVWPVLATKESTDAPT